MTKLLLPSGKRVHGLYEPLALKFLSDFRTLLQGRSVLVAVIEPVEPLSRPLPRVLGRVSHGHEPDGDYVFGSSQNLGKLRRLSPGGQQAAPHAEVGRGEHGVGYGLAGLDPEKVLRPLLRKAHQPRVGVLGEKLVRPAVRRGYRPRGKKNGEGLYELLVPGVEVYEPGYHHGRLAQVNLVKRRGALHYPLELLLGIGPFVYDYRLGRVAVALAGRVARRLQNLLYLPVLDLLPRLEKTETSPVSHSFENFHASVLLSSGFLSTRIFAPPTGSSSPRL